ncbi:MAG: hypothetical protein K0R63_319 [Rickettsiales bacterium]|jgi:regulator of CtrA degradation|nr:hypothetical protein [Rickettsiales bacterium]
MSVLTELYGSRDGFRFLERDYKTTVQLLVRARDYFQTQGARDKIRLSDNDKLYYTLVMSTITTRLGNVAAWLMLWKAVHQEEIAFDEAKLELFQLLDVTGHPEDDTKFVTVIPLPVRHLLEESTEIYERIRRLDGRIQEKLSKTPSACTTFH